MQMMGQPIDSLDYAEQLMISQSLISNIGIFMFFNLNGISIFA